MGWFFIDQELEWDWNDEMTLKWMEWSHEEGNNMMEWRNVAELEGFSELRVSPLFEKLPSFPLIRSFFIILGWRNEVKMSRMTQEWYLSIVIFISCHSEMTGNDGMGRNEAVFLGEEKTGFRDTSHSTIIPTFRLSFLKWAWMTAKWPWKILIGCCLP